MIVFAAAYIVITIFHEPWFDEAQAWQIAKCANLSDILFEIPHYEGHPPLWHLILAIPAKAGVPFEIGLKTIGLIISLASVYLILFKMPYPKWMRCLLPFSFFVFYQYGIIVRPYGLMLLILLMMALKFPERNTHPWKFIFLMILLCLTSAYGMVLAAGIAVCMVWELIREKGMKGFIRGLFRDSRTQALCVLLAAAVIIVVQILPRPDTWVTSANATNSFPLCLLCALLTFPAECTLTTSSWFSVDASLLQHVSISALELVAMCVIGVLIWALLICVSSKKLLKYLLIPYILFAFFAADVYFQVHHVGTVLLFLLFWFGILFVDNERFEIGRVLITKINASEKNRQILKKTAILICVICLAMPVYWLVRSTILELQVEYSFGRTASEYLVNHDLVGKQIMSDWWLNDSLDSKEGTMNNMFAMGNPTLIDAYFDHNLFYNFNNGKDDESYMQYRLISEEETQAAFERWKKEGAPDLTLGLPDFEAVFHGEVSQEEYSLIQLFEINYIWKGKTFSRKLPLYMRNDLLSEYNFMPITDGAFYYRTNGISITDEIREQFEEGVPMEEILKPYLDAMFGEESG